MTSSVWRLFPYPTSHDGRAPIDGSLVGVPKICVSCINRYCISNLSPVSKIETCKFGMNYVRLSDAQVLLGIVVSDLNLPTKQAKKRRRQEPQACVKGGDLERAVEGALELDKAAIENYNERKKEQIDEWITKGVILDEMLKNLQPQFERSFKTIP